MELTVTDLRKAFVSPAGERIEVLRGLSLSAVAGETVAVTGASGSGKSTLLHLIGGLEAADQGQISLDRFAIGQAPQNKAARFRNHKIGFIFQFHHLLPDLTAVENVALPLMIGRVARREALRRSALALEELGLGNRLAHPVGHLSGGEQQRIAVSRALITKPTLVLADEPSGNLDPVIGEEISRFLVSYARKSSAIVILATHNNELARISSRMLLLRDGQLSAC